MTSKRKTLFIVLQVLGTALALTYVLVTTDLSKVGDALARVSFSAALTALAFLFVGLFLAAIRWKLLLMAYAADNPPPVLTLFRLYCVGLFYNSFLPGGVGGDVVRGLMGRAAFREHGATKSLAVVMVERILGLSGLLAVVSIAVALRPVPIVSGAWLFALGGFGFAAMALLSLPILRRLPEGKLGRFGETLRSMPAMTRLWPAALAFLLSIGTQCTVALVGLVLWQDIAPGSLASDAFVLVPLASIAAFFPFTVGGAGAREGAFVELAARFMMLGRADATAVSLAVWFVQMAAGLVGGGLQLVRARTPTEATKVDPSA